MTIRERLRSESGMTIIELIISLSILGLIVGPITIAMMLGLITSSGAKERISDSAAAQLMSAYFVTDVESSKTVDVPTSTSPTCGPDTGTVKVRLTWVDAASPSVVTSQRLVEYIDRDTGDDGLHDLWRYECDRSATPNLLNKQRLVRSVDFAGLASLGTQAVTCNSSGVTCPTGANRSVGDAVTNSTTTITSATANFTAGDVGKSVSGSGIPGGATIASVTNATTAVLSTAATASGTGLTLTFGQPVSVNFNVRVNANSGSRASKADTRSYAAYTFTLQALRRETPSS